MTSCSPQTPNTLGLGTTQLYNSRVVYNHKCHGRFTLGGLFLYSNASLASPENFRKNFCSWDLLNNVSTLAEETETLLVRARAKAKALNASKLRLAARRYGKVATRKFFDHL